MSRAISISVQNVKKSFPKVFGATALFKYGGRAPRAVALEDVSVEVLQGELFGLLGPNGAGKTTLLRLMATLAYPDSGRILIEGVNVTKQPRLAKSLIGLCTSEERSFYFRLTARQNLEFFGGLAGLRGRTLRRRIDDVIDMLDLRLAIDQRFGGYSSGMRQRLTVARALLTDPPVLLLDEPTRAVDPVHAEDLRRLIREELVERQGKTVILATNLLDEAWSVCDRLAVFSGGRIAAQGSPAELDAYVKPLSRYEIHLDHVSEDLLTRTRAVTGITHTAVRPQSEGVLLEIEMKPNSRSFTDLMGELCANGSLIHEVRSIAPKPVEVFRELTQSGPSR